jgi:hypothetical protein
MVSDYTENSLVEQPAIELLSSLGWDTANCFYETFGPQGTLGRETPYDVVVEPKLRAALRRLNPGLADEAINFAVEELTKDRGLMSSPPATMWLWMSTIIRFFPPHQWIAHLKGLDNFPTNEKRALVLR